MSISHVSSAKRVKLGAYLGWPLRLQSLESFEVRKLWLDMGYGCWLAEQPIQPGPPPRRPLKLLQPPPVNEQGMQHDLPAGAHLSVEECMCLCQLQWVCRGTTSPSLDFSSPGEVFRSLGEGLVSTSESTSEASSRSLRREKCEPLDP